MDAAGGYLMALALFVFGALFFEATGEKIGRCPGAKVNILRFIGAALLSLALAAARWLP